jgi:hypothetical protein
MYENSYSPYSPDYPAYTVEEMNDYEYLEYVHSVDMQWYFEEQEKCIERMKSYEQ